MRYDHCRFCGKTVRLAELHVSCPACLEKIELELLKRAYWVIHGSGSEFVRPEQVISRVMAVRDQKLDLSLLRYWVLRGHLKTDVFGRIGVPAEEDIL
ncbi:MAG TPA: hypothetical protein PLZ55_12550, partial [bacterium]|nr:hypothetical protein [bacterium]